MLAPQSLDRSARDRSLTGTSPQRSSLGQSSLERALLRGSPLRHFGMLLFALLFLIAPVGCGDEKPSEKASGKVVDFTALRGDAETARDAALAAGADKFAAQEFDKGVDYLAKAEDFELENPSKAKQRYRSSKNKFVDALEKTKKSQGKLNALAAEMKKYEEIRDRLKEAGAEALVADSFAKAETDFAGAKSSSETGDLKKAEMKLRYAMSAISTAEKQLGRLTANQKNADEERASMETEKVAALAETAEVLAKDDFNYASDLEGDAISAYDKNEYSQSIGLFRNARHSYASAAQYARDQKALAVSEVNPGRSGGGTRERPEDPPEVDEIEKPDFGDALDMSDLPTLYAGLGRFDADRKFELSWTSGIEFQKDVNIYAGRLEGDKANIIWAGAAGVSEGAEDYVFSGNTVGHLLIDCKFRDKATVRAKVQFLLLGPKPLFEIVLMSDDGKKFFASEFGTNIFSVEDSGRLKKPKARAIQGAFRKPFNTWIQKREPYELVFTYFKADEDTKGILVCKLDGEETARFETDKIRSGKIGFRWSSTKFIVKELEMKGAVDEEWAKDKLLNASAGSASDGPDDIGF